MGPWPIVSSLWLQLPVPQYSRHVPEEWTARFQLREVEVEATELLHEKVCYCSSLLIVYVLCCNVSISVSTNFHFFIAKVWCFEVSWEDEEQKNNAGGWFHNEEPVGVSRLLSPRSHPDRSKNCDLQRSFNGFPCTGINWNPSQFHHECTVWTFLENGELQLLQSMMFAGFRDIDRVFLGSVVGGTEERAWQ